MSAAAAILVGGQGQRLGGVDKPLIEIGGRAILDRQLQILEARFEHIALCTSRPDPYRDRNLTIIADHQDGVGPLGGILAALDWSPDPTVFVVAGDMPHLSGTVIDRFLEVADRNPDAGVVATRVAGVAQPLHAVYYQSASKTLKAALARGEHSIRKLLEGSALPVVWIREDDLRRFDPELTFAGNVNRPDDLP